MEVACVREDIDYELKFALYYELVDVSADGADLWHVALFRFPKLSAATV